MLAEEGLLDKEHFGVSVMASFGYHNDEPYAKNAAGHGRHRYLG